MELLEDARLKTSWWVFGCLITDISGLRLESHDAGKSVSCPRDVMLAQAIWTKLRNMIL